jgi:hypothetical protein
MRACKKVDGGRQHLKRSRSQFLPPTRPQDRVPAQARSLLQFAQRRLL